jgi:hypothetical protein
MGQTFAIIGGVLLLVYFFNRTKLFEVVTSTLSGGGFCAAGYVPTSLGIAPEWSNVLGLLSAVRFFVDPLTGCAIANDGEITGRVPVNVLTDTRQIALFLNLNGAAPVVGDVEPQPGAVIGDALPPLFGYDWNCPQGSHVELRDGEHVCVVDAPVVRVR